MLNRFKTFILMTALTLVLIWAGDLIGGRDGMLVAFLVALVLNFTSYWYSDKIVLSMYRAKEISEQEMPELYQEVRKLSQKAGLPVPRLYIISHPSPNAFATGRNPEKAVIAITEGLLRLTNKDELLGVVGHELSHIKNRDTLIQTVAATIAGAIMVLASFARWALVFGRYGYREEKKGGLELLVAAIVAPIAGMIIQMAISRSREYLADSGSASLTGNPLALAGALRKLDIGTRELKLPAPEATAPLFIVNPLTRGGLAVLFSTHPPVAKRIERLVRMAQVY